MSGLKSRNKGKRGERELAKALSALLGIPLSRGVQYQGGPDSPDVAGLSDHGLHCEVKRDESTLAKRTYRAIEQARNECGEGTPFVASRRNRSEWLVVLRMEDVIDFAHKISAITEQ